MKFLSSTTATFNGAQTITFEPLNTWTTHVIHLFPLVIKVSTLSNNNKRNGCRLTSSKNHLTHPILSSSFSSLPTTTSAAAAAAATTATSDFLPLSSTAGDQHHWIVLMEKLPDGLRSKSEIINYYVKTLTKVSGSEKEAQMCIYDGSWETNFGFCCDIDEETSRQLASLPEVLSVRPDPDINSSKKDYSFSDLQLGRLSNSEGGTSLLFPGGNSKYWLVRMEKPAVEVVTKAQMVDYYVQILTKVLGYEKDAQMCIYHISWKNNFGFCCELNEECAQELAGNEKSKESTATLDSSDANQTPSIKTKRLFVTGLSFYTSEKTLRAAFESFGELVEVKIIMDKISKRSKGYAFIEYTTEEAAGAALKEMNGKIINGWMIVVDVAKVNPPKYSRGRPRPTI
ncbi:organelle RRM domain-containing protein 1, chloroplastic isoform X2 [Macadamia integrifolia]|uniref:organelle RRM domain-containing protein 1, chloroplastic isoform X2 n=1 Tax=Macadamia integrifolia TaxID=60698 RepID=UPI001C4F1C85|nr:organelle RRM domain-containing protein 1, chloroplastic isoform X2 [Macadamia integrifolia]